MEDNRQQQIEALQVAHDYSKRLINGIKNVSEELRGNRLVDTDKYLNEVLNGINWIIEVTNATLSVLNEDEEVINKEQVNAAIGKLSSALSKKEDCAIAEALSNDVLSFVEAIEKATAKLK